MFHSVKTVGDRDIQSLNVNYIYPGVSNIINIIRLSIIGREYSITKKTLILIQQGLLQRKVSFILILSNMLIAKMTIKQTATHIHISVTISIKFGTVKNLEYSNIKILLSLD